MRLYHRPCYPVSLFPRNSSRPTLIIASPLRCPVHPTSLWSGIDRPSSEAEAIPTATQMGHCRLPPHCRHRYPGDVCADACYEASRPVLCFSFLVCPDLEARVIRPFDNHWLRPGHRSHHHICSTASRHINRHYRKGGRIQDGLLHDLRCRIKCTFSWDAHLVCLYVRLTWKSGIDRSLLL